MKYNLNKNTKKNNNNTIVTTASLLTLATIVVILSSMAAISVEATTTSNATTTTNTTTTIPPSPGIELSPQPIYQERNIRTQTPINQTHIQLTYTGNGVLTLPNTTETINTTSNGSVILSTITQFAQGTETTRTEDGNETATATFAFITRLNPDTGEGKGIAVTTFHTNSTGMLAPLNGMILSGLVDIQPTEDIVTLWEWQSGIPLPQPLTTAEERPSPTTETPIATDTTADDSTATAPPVGEEGEEQQEQQQQITPTVPPAPNPLFE